MYLVLISEEPYGYGYYGRFLETREEVYKLVNSSKVTKVFKFDPGKQLEITADFKEIPVKPSNAIGDSKKTKQNNIQTRRK